MAAQVWDVFFKQRDHLMVQIRRLLTMKVIYLQMCTLITMYLF